MSSVDTTTPTSQIVSLLAGLGGRAAACALRPLTDTIDVVVRIGLRMERHAVDRMLESGELELIMTSVLNDARIQAALQQALESDSATQVVDRLFDSGLIDHLLDRLAASDALWRLVDEIAQSRSVKTALSQHGLGFADQIGGAARRRIRNADHRAERTARRPRQHRHHGGPNDPDVRGQ
jgi:hypothetical protein